MNEVERELDLEVRATFGEDRGKSRRLQVVGTCPRKELRLEMSTACLGVSLEGREGGGDIIEALSQDLDAGTPQHSLFTATTAHNLFNSVLNSSSHWQPSSSGLHVHSSLTVIQHEHQLCVSASI